MRALVVSPPDVASRHRLNERCNLQILIMFSAEKDSLYGELLMSSCETVNRRVIPVGRLRTVQAESKLKSRLLTCRRQIRRCISRRK